MKRKLLFLLLVACCMGASACSLPFLGREDSVSVSFTEEEKVATVEQVTEDMVAIRVLKVQGEETLIGVMQTLQADGELTFTESGGMIMSVNGKENAADWSACWMLYTSDEEMSNAEWGVVEYDGKSYASAILGAEGLTVAVGEYYILSYVSF